MGDSRLERRAFLALAARTLAAAGALGAIGPHRVLAGAQDAKAFQGREVFDRLLAGGLLQPDTLEQMLTVVPISERPEETVGAGMGLYEDRSRWGRLYHHGGGGPGYSLSATVYPDTAIGCVAIAVFVNSSCGLQARDCEAALLADVIDQIQ